MSRLESRYQIEKPIRISKRVSEIWTLSPVINYNRVFRENGEEKGIIVEKYMFEKNEFLD